LTFGLEPGEILPMPVAHAQGRFTSRSAGLFDRLEQEQQIVFKYCRPDGGPADSFPLNPNGSERMAAAVSNPEGNVVAIMPHPERCAWMGQVPVETGGNWSARRLRAQGSKRAMQEDGPGARLFRALGRYIEERT
jgi:phosphoribosylformylglycinamidine (FGAM) synthase-like amidotransferase family enzyme